MLTFLHLCAFPAFHNGDVKRMWRWWERSDPVRLAAVPGLIGEPSLNDPKKQESTVYLSVANESSSLPTRSSANCPRTLKDLLAMTGAAKEAQWGEQDESEASSTGVPALGSNFFEDDSDVSSELGEDQAEDVAEASGSKIPKRVYESYESYQRSLVEALAGSQKTLDQSEKEGVADGVFSRTVGPASDMLSPLVKICRQYDKWALNHQSPDLARDWKLGDFNVGAASSNDASQQSCVSLGVHVVDDALVSQGSLSKRGKRVCIGSGINCRTLFNMFLFNSKTLLLQSSPAIALFYRLRTKRDTKHRQVLT
jgi:hypothetical protein